MKESHREVNGVVLERSVMKESQREVMKESQREVNGLFWKEVS